MLEVGQMEVSWGRFITIGHNMIIYYCISFLYKGSIFHTKSALIYNHIISTYYILTMISHIKVGKIKIKID